MKKLIILLVVLSSALAACDQAPQSTETVTTTEEQMVDNDGDFATMAPQPTSPIRGVYTNASDNMDLDAMEEGLQDIVGTYIDPSDYIYSPGQVITSEEAEMLVGRELTEAQYTEALKVDPEAQNIGLNPPLADGANPKDSKTYVNTIIEQDYYKVNEDGTQTIDTIAIGFGINPIYTYTVDEKEESIEIPMEELNEYANNLIASKMDKFIRSKEGYEDVTIIYGFYLQSDSELYPGTFYAQGISKSSEEPIDYTLLDNKNVLFPSAEGEEIDKQLSDDVNTILSKGESFFPVSSGAYCYGTYENGNLVQLNFKVILNSYSSIDVQSFLNYIEDVISETSVQNVDYVMEITSPQGDALGLMESKDGKAYKYVY